LDEQRYAGKISRADDYTDLSDHLAGCRPSRRMQSKLSDRYLGTATLNAVGTGHRASGTEDEDQDELGASERARRRWTAEEQKKLDELLDAGKTVVEIAPVLQRTRPSIYSRLQSRYRKRRKPSTNGSSAI
jgi:hypothetical protein